MSVMAKLKKAFPFQQGGMVEVDVGSYRRFMRRDYQMQMADGRLVPMPDLRGIIHECENDVHSDVRTMQIMLEEADIRDGDEFEILVTKTGHRPHGDRLFMMDKLGIYRQETDEEVLKRIEQAGINNLDKGA